MQKALTFLPGLPIFSLMTKKRETLLKMLNESPIPLNAGQIHERLAGELDLATVYRGLKYLEDEEFLDSFLFNCLDRGTERYYTAKGDHHRHFLHCQDCHRFFVMDFCPLEESLGGIEEKYGFKISEHVLTIKGICRECQNLIEEGE